MNDFTGSLMQVYAVSKSNPHDERAKNGMNPDTFSEGRGKEHKANPILNTPPGQLNFVCMNGNMRFNIFLPIVNIRIPKNQNIQNG